MLVHPQALFEVAFGKDRLWLAGLPGATPEVLQRARWDPDRERLDAACGSGNAALAAARRFCRVVGVDGDPGLLARARRRADAEGLEATFLGGEAEDDTLVLRVDYLEVVARAPSWR